MIEGKLKKRIQAYDKRYEHLVGVEVPGEIKKWFDEAKQELLADLEMVWAAEYKDHGETQWQLWPLDKKYWGKKGYSKYKPYVDPWKTAEKLLKWFGDPI